MDYTTGKNFEKIFEQLEEMELRLSSIEKKLGLKLKEKKNDGTNTG